jgi:diguanylate cyclase (GGDEF)-like protein
MYLLMPYLPLLLSTVLVLRKTIDGAVDQVDLIEICCGFGVFAVVILRQLVTIIDNTRLLSLLRESERTLHHQAHHDTLTGLANRALFQDRLEEAIEANRHGHLPFGLLFVDLDDFKTVNDVSGHASGDALLAMVARRLRGCVRAGDTVARLGGDEFGVLVGGIEEPLLVADRIVAALGEDAVLDGEIYAVGASVGVVVCRDADASATAQSLLRHADNAMYEAKRDGKRGLVIHSPV